MTKQKSDSKAESLFDEIFGSAKHPKTRKAIERIKGACDYLEERKIGISASEVAILCRPTPALQSIHNNRQFKQYIEVRRVEQKSSVTPLSKEVKFVSRDPDTAAALYALEVQARREKLEKQNLKRALELSGEYDIQATLRTGRLVGILQRETQVNVELSAALRRLFDPERLRRAGLEIIGERIVAPNKNGRVFLERDDFRIIWKAATSELKEQAILQGDPRVE
jgi:hypothetical protein